MTYLKNEDVSAITEAVKKKETFEKATKDKKAAGEEGADAKETPAATATAAKARPRAARKQLSAEENEQRR